MSAWRSSWMFAVLSLCRILLPMSGKVGAQEPPRFLFQSPGAFLLPGLPGTLVEADVADLDGDALPDVVASVDGPPALVTYLADAPLLWQVPGPRSAPFAGQLWLVDWNGDGALDAFVRAALLVERSTGVAVFPGRGDGTFGEPQTLVTPERHSAWVMMAFADLDADGHLDAVEDGQPAVLFGPELKAPVGLSTGGRGAYGIAALDADADGRTDLVFGGELLRLYRQLGSRALFGYEMLQTTGRSLVPEDIDDDGADEILTTTPAGTVQALALAREDGQWRARARTLGLPVAPENPVRDIAIGDFDGDQITDAFGLQSSGEGLYVKGRRVDGALSLDPVRDSIPLAGFTLSSLLRPRELNADGVLDVVLGRGFFLGRRGAPPAASDLVARLGYGARAVVVDVDGDGFDDVINERPLGESGLEVRRGSAGGVQPPSMLESPAGISLLAAGILTPGDRPSLFWRQGAGVLQVDLSAGSRLGTPVPLPVGTDFVQTISLIAPGPTRERGGLLAVHGDPAAPEANLARFDVVPPRTLVKSWAIPIPRPVLVPQAVDLDGDGAEDYLVPGFTTLQILWGDAPATAATSLRAAGEALSAVVAADFDGDRSLDLALGTRSTTAPGPVTTWYGRGSRRFERGPSLTDPLYPLEATTELLTGDFDRDGFSDLLRVTYAGYANLHRGGPGGLEPASAAVQAAAAPGGAWLGNFAGSGALDLLSLGESAERNTPTWSLVLAVGELADVDFRRGDADGDGRLQITDPIHVLRWLFLGGPGAACADAADANDDGTIALSDAVTSLRYQFLDEPALPPPFPGCGRDPTGDALDCSAFAPCP